MGLSEEDAVKRARRDLAKRLGLAEEKIKEVSIERVDFPDTALGASVEDEMSGQMITSGWRIRLSASGHGGHEYRASEDELRLYKFKGSNYRI